MSETTGGSIIHLRPRPEPVASGLPGLQDRPNLIAFRRDILTLLDILGNRMPLRATARTMTPPPISAATGRTRRRSCQPAQPAQ